jgi:NADPH2:quinone reductase
VTPPFILGIEFAGTVISAPATSAFQPGDRVFGGAQGCYSQQIAVKESSLHRLPRNWTFTEAAGLAATAPVGYGALVIRGGLKKGETVLVHAGAGGLGLMAVQIASAVGAIVIATSSSDEKLEVARRFGAHKTVNYSGGREWWKEVLEMTGGVGVSVVYDPVGLVVSELISIECLRRKY